jgi:hypothetical protein
LAWSLLIFSIICLFFDASISSLHCSFILVIVSLHTNFYSNAQTYWSNVIIINDLEKSIRGFSTKTLYNLLDGALSKVINELMWLLYTTRVLDANVFKFVDSLFTNYELLTSPIGHGLLAYVVVHS